MRRYGRKSNPCWRPTIKRRVHRNAGRGRRGQWMVTMTVAARQRQDRSLRSALAARPRRDGRGLSGARHRLGRKVALKLLPAQLTEDPDADAPL